MLKSSKSMLKILKKVNAVVAAFFFVFYPLYPILTMPVAHASDTGQTTVAKTNPIVTDDPVDSSATTDAPASTETPTAEPSVVSPEPLVSPIAEPTVSPEPNIEPLLIASPTPDSVVSPEPNPIVNPDPTNTTDGVWQIMPNGKAQTRSVVSMSETYVAPQNENVTVKFTELPDNPGVLTISEIKLSAEEQAQLGAVSDTAYDITSTMPDGSFKYDLTLPKPDDVKVVTVKYAETKTDLMTAAQDVTQTTEEIANTVTVNSLNHFTLFIVTGPTSGQDGGSTWSNPDKARASDNVRASAGGSGNILELKNFNLDMPTGVVVNGIEVSVEGYTGGTRQANISLSWDGGTNYTTGTGTGLKNTNVPGTTSASEAVTTLGGATDLWGRTWSAGDFADAKFRVKLNSTTGTGSESVYVDQVKVSVTYEDDVPSCPTPTIAKGTRPNDEYVSGNTIYYATDKGSGTGNFVVSEAATDANSGIDKVNFPATGGITGGGNANSAPYQKTYSWTNTDTYNGSATITCYDNSSQTTTSTLNIFRDITAPVVNAVGLDKYVVKNGDTIDITSNVVETGSGVASCHAYWTNHTGIATGTDTDLGDLGTDCSGSVTVPSSSGNHYILIGSTSGLGDNVGHFQTVGLASSIITVDNVSPTATVSYNVTTLTNGDVIATLNPSEPVTVTNNGGSTTYTFTSNDSFTFEFVDAAGNTGNATATVSNIDKTNPLISFADDVDLGPTQSDVVTINVSDTNLSSYHYAFSSNDSCVVDYTGSFASGSAITFSDESRNGEWICVKASDSAGNDAYSYSANPLNIDVTPPQFSSAVTKDLDGNGKIDAIELTFNEAINDSMLGAGADGWDVDGYTGESIGTGNTNNDNILLLSFNEGSVPDSGNTPTVTYTSPAESTHDIAGNELASNSWATTDEAKPVVLSAETQDVNGNGKIDNIKLTFSEAIKDSELTTGADGWDVDGYEGASIGTGSVANDNILLLGFNESGSYDVDSTPTVTYTSPSDSTHDMADNELANYSATTTDKSAPTKPTADPIGGGYYADQPVSLTGENGADIRYTTDGTDPSASSTQYVGTPILIDHSQTLKAIATDPVGNVSPVMTEEYGIAPIISPESVFSGTTSNPGTEQIITWDTDDISTSRVVYGLESVSTLGSAPNYGYQHSTDTFNLAPNKVTHHVVTLTGLQPDKVYYYRVISAGSPENISAEMDFKTGTDHETADSSGQSTTTSTTTKLATVVSSVLGTTITQNATPTTQSSVLTSTKTNSGTTNASNSPNPKPENTPEKGTVEAATLEATPIPTQSKNSLNGIQIKWWWYLIALIIVTGIYYYNRQTKNKQK